MSEIQTNDISNTNLIEAETSGHVARMEEKMSVFLAKLKWNRTLEVHMRTR